MAAIRLPGWLALDCCIRDAEIALWAPVVGAYHTTACWDARGYGALLVQRALPDMLVQRSVTVDGKGSALGTGLYKCHCLHTL